MIQVENEVEFMAIPVTVQKHPIAFYARPVPHELLNGLQKFKNDLHPTVVHLWNKTVITQWHMGRCFWKRDQLQMRFFMAWYYAKFFK